jgi:selenide,water dikinase
VVSDIYSCGVVHIDELKIILSIPDELNEDEQQQVADEIIEGFREAAKPVKIKLTLERMNINPWCIIGGIASAVCTRDEIIFPTKAIDGDALILTKPLGVQLATNAPIWMEEDSDNWKKLSEFLTKEDILEAYAKAVKSMTTLNHLGAKLMHKYEGHCSTDITGFGFVGHAENLLTFQEAEVDFVITSMPIIKNVKKIAEILNRMQKLNAGKMVETSGGLLISLPAANAQSFCDEFSSISGDECWIVGRVIKGSRKVILEDPKIIEV